MVLGMSQVPALSPQVHAAIFCCPEGKLRPPIGLRLSDADRALLGDVLAGAGMSENQKLRLVIRVGAAVLKDHKELLELWSKKLF